MKRILIVVVAVLGGCAAVPSPELAYFKCVQEYGSYVKCQPLEIVK